MEFSTKRGGGVSDGSNFLSEKRMNNDEDLKHICGKSPRLDIDELTDNLLYRDNHGRGDEINHPTFLGLIPLNHTRLGKVLKKKIKIQ